MTELAKDQKISLLLINKLKLRIFVNTDFDYHLESKNIKERNSLSN